jgi:hypothetical protein
MMAKRLSLVSLLSVVPVRVEASVCVWRGRGGGGRVETKGKETSTKQNKKSFSPFSRPLFLPPLVNQPEKKTRPTMQRSLTLRVNAAAKKSAPAKKTSPKSAGASKPSLSKYYGEARARGGESWWSKLPTLFVRKQRASQGEEERRRKGCTFFWGATSPADLLPSAELLCSHRLASSYDTPRSRRWKEKKENALLSELWRGGRAVGANSMITFALVSWPWPLLLSNLHLGPTTKKQIGPDRLLYLPGGLLDRSEVPSYLNGTLAGE